MQKISGLLDNKIVFFVVFLVLGTATTMGAKALMLEVVYEGSYKKHFYHPYMQTLCLFFGQMLCLIPFYFIKLKKSTAPIHIQEGQNKKTHKIWIFLIPSVTDTFAFTLQFLSVNFLPLSTALMLAGGSIISTAIISKFVNKTKLIKRHISSCLLASAGILLVGSSTFAENEQTFPISFASQIFGFVCAIASLIFYGYQYAYEEYLFTKYPEIHPLEMTGYEGFWGCILQTIIVIILNYIPCEISSDVCSVHDNDNFYMQSTVQFFRQIWNNDFLLWNTFVQIFGLAIVIFLSIRLVKMFAAVGRALFSSLKTISVWGLGLLITLIFPNSIYKFESTNGWVNFIKLVGFIPMVVGSLIYVEAIPIGSIEKDEKPRQSLLESQLSDRQ